MSQYYDDDQDQGTSTETVLGTVGGGLAGYGAHRYAKREDYKKLAENKEARRDVKGKNKEGLNEAGERVQELHQEYEGAGKSFDAEIAKQQEVLDAHADLQRIEKGHEQNRSAAELAVKDAESARTDIEAAHQESLDAHRTSEEAVARLNEKYEGVARAEKPGLEPQYETSFAEPKNIREIKSANTVERKAAEALNKQKGKARKALEPAQQRLDQASRAETEAFQAHEHAEQTLGSVQEKHASIIDQGQKQPVEIEGLEGDALEKANADNAKIAEHNEAVDAAKSEIQAAEAEVTAKSSALETAKSEHQRAVGNLDSVAQTHEHVIEHVEGKGPQVIADENIAKLKQDHAGAVTKAEKHNKLLKEAQKEMPKAVEQHQATFEQTKTASREIGNADRAIATAEAHHDALQSTQRESIEGWKGADEKLTKIAQEAGIDTSGGAAAIEEAAKAKIEGYQGKAQAARDSFLKTLPEEEARAVRHFGVQQEHGFTNSIRESAGAVKDTVKASPKNFAKGFVNDVHQGGESVKATVSNALQNRRIDNITKNGGDASLLAEMKYQKADAPYELTSHADRVTKARGRTAARQTGMFEKQVKPKKMPKPAGGIRSTIAGLAIGAATGHFVGKMTQGPKQGPQQFDPYAAQAMAGAPVVPPYGEPVMGGYAAQIAAEQAAAQGQSI